MHNVAHVDPGNGHQRKGHSLTQSDTVGVTLRSDPQPPAPAPHSRNRSLVFRTGLVVLVTVTLVWRYWTLSSWSWFQDDWIYLTKTAELPFWQYVTQNYNGHVMPGQFVVAWLITKAAPLDYSYAVATTLFFVLASLLAWAAALRTIFGERVRLLYPLIILALSPVFMPISLWWAAAIQTFPLQLFMGLSVLFTARYVLRGARRQDLAGLAASYALGLFFWQKALLLAIPIIFVAVLVERGTLPERIRTTLRTVRIPAAVTALYVPLYVWFTRSGDAAGTQLFEKRGLGETVSFFLTGILDVGIPSLLGGPWQSLSEPQQVFGSSSGVLTLMLLALGVLGCVLAVKLRRGGGIAVAMTLAYTAASWGLLFTSSRFDMLGVFLVRDARYAADILPVALLTIAFVVTPTVSEDRSSWLHKPLRSHMAVRVFKAGATAFVALVAISALYSSGRIWDAMAPSTPKYWVDNLTADATRAANIASIHNSNAPDHVIFSVYYAEDARISQLLKPLPLELRFNEPAEHLLIPDWAGHLMEVDVDPASRAVTPPPVEGCGYLVDGGKTTVIPLSSGLYNWEWGYQFSYFSGQPAVVTVRTDTKSVDLRLDRGLHQVQFIMEDSASALRVTGHPDGSPVCITEVQAGPIKASDRWIGRANQP